MARGAVVERSAQEKPVSERVVSAVAEKTDSDPTSLEPLYSVIETDALDALFATSGLGAPRSPSRIEFAYSGCNVVVTGDGSVTVRESGQGE